MIVKGKPIFRNLGENLSRMERRTQGYRKRGEEWGARMGGRKGGREGGRGRKERRPCMSEYTVIGISISDRCSVGLH